MHCQFQTTRPPRYVRNIYQTFDQRCVLITDSPTSLLITFVIERHKDRHATKDRRAGGAGLGILGTKKKFLNHSRAARVGSTSSVQSTSTRNETPGDFTQTEILDEAYQRTDGPRTSDEKQGTTGLEIGTEFVDNILHPDNRRLSAIMSQDPPLNDAVQHESAQNDSIGDMYHDLTFDLVHFNVTGFTTPRSDLYLPTDTTQFHSRLRSDPSPDIAPTRSVYGDADTSTSSGRGPCPERINNQLNYSNEAPEAQRRLSLAYSPTGTVQQARRESLPENPSPLVHRYSFTPSFEQSRNTLHTPLGPSSTTLSNKPLLIAIPLEKRAELLGLISEIRPVRPDGSLINGESPEFSLTNIQIYLNSFFGYFNTSYPILHVPTLDIYNLDPIALLSFIIMGATYKDKHAHQLSVCLYDAIIPYIFSGLLSSMVPDLAILQAFMVLECYGMYRAGPYQRENAILIHRLLLNVCSFIHSLFLFLLIPNYCPVYK
jgi:Fungal specific transcription factor domain